MPKDRRTANIHVLQYRVQTTYPVALKVVIAVTQIKKKCGGWWRVLLRFLL